jgi:hypothetical protein
MSQEGFAQVAERASTEATFRALLARDPERALAGYNLTADERATLLRGDNGQLRELGVDARVTKDIPQPTTDTPWPTLPSVS